MPFLGIALEIWYVCVCVNVRVNGWVWVSINTNVGVKDKVDARKNAY